MCEKENNLDKEFDLCLNIVVSYFYSFMNGLLSVTDFSSIRCLLVEDESFQQEIAVVVLKQAGINDISVATDGLKAVAMLEKAQEKGAPFELIISDLGLPNMDGVEFIRHLANNNVNSGIIIISSMDKKIIDTVELVAKTHALNILGSIEKPLKPAAIKDLLTNMSCTITPKQKSDSYSLDATDLQNAIEQMHIESFFQPKFHFSNKSVAGMEALARWRDPDLGFISPNVFIPLAENNGLISLLTERILECAISGASPLIAANLVPSVSINVSVDLLDSLSFPDYVYNMTRKYGLEPKAVVLEVTESRGISDLAKALDSLVRLRMKGFRLSLDDYGTGSSTLEQLSRIPFSELKIDQSFVTGTWEKSEQRIILESTVTMGRNLGLSIVAEGIETTEDWNYISSLGCDEGQGFLMCRPLPVSDLAPFLAGSSW